MKRAGDLLGAQANVRGHSNGSQGVPHVVRAKQWHLESAERYPPPPDAETSRFDVTLEVVGLPVGVVTQSKRFDTRACRVSQQESSGTIGTKQEEPTPGNEVHEASKCERDGIQVGVDVRVIELDVVDDRQVRQVLEKLRGLVEKRAVVLVALDDESRPWPIL